jgi:hypothetical protein
MGYAGWIHVRGESEGHEGWAEIYVNLPDGVRVLAEHGPGGLEVQMHALARHEKVTYRTRDNAVRLGRLSDEEVARWDVETHGFPLELGDVLKAWPKERVTRSQEDGLERYELSPSEDQSAIPAGAACAAGNCFWGGLKSGVMWTDAGSGLIRRMELRSAGRALSCRYTYGGPGVRDVYDLGVPRETRVIDGR